MPNATGRLIVKLLKVGSGPYLVVRRRGWVLLRVTVCVPVRNGARTIRRTLDSILAQDYPNFEVIVSDNCSTDETAKIVQEYSSCGVSYHLNTSLEAYAESNWNHVLSLAQGPLISLYHADDIYAPTMVRRQVEFLHVHPDVSAVFTMTQRIDMQNRPIRMGTTHLPAELRGQECFGFPDFLNAVLRYGTLTCVPTMMTRREVIDAVGAFRWQTCGSAADVDLYLRMAKDWGPIGLIDEPLHRYRISAQQMSTQLSQDRTDPEDFFVSLDQHISVPEERAFASPKALALHGLHLAVERILCAMNLLVQGRGNEARSRLRAALCWRHFVTAFRHPRLLLRLLIGIGFLVCAYLGVGQRLVKRIYRAKQLELRRKREPIG